jgi:AraC family transcriptional regulator
MSLTNKVLWTIERNLNRNLTLGEIAEAAGISRYHLAHAFGEAAGRSVMDYVRGRRLTEAAYALAAGAKSILDVALDTGYASHEAFSRAFRAQFETTPEDVRDRASVESLALVTPLQLPEKAHAQIAPPAFEKKDKLLFVGLAERCFHDTRHHIPGQWQRFMRHYAEIEHRAQDIPAAISANIDEDGNFDYVCAVEVSRFGEIPRGLTKLKLAPQTYAVFQHAQHVSKIGDTFDAIWNVWLPESGCKALDAPSLERANPGFDPRSGEGGETIWIPVAA